MFDVIVNLTDNIFSVISGKTAEYRIPSISTNAIGTTCGDILVYVAGI
jgi:hypothetical protein